MYPRELSGPKQTNLLIIFVNVQKTDWKEGTKLARPSTGQHRIPRRWWLTTLSNVEVASALVLAPASDGRSMASMTYRSPTTFPFPNLCKRVPSMAQFSSTLRAKHAAVWS